MEVKVNCEVCTLRESCSQQVPSYIPKGPFQYQTLWVGQAPGKTELLTQRPFTGGAGKTLFSCMSTVGLSKKDMPQANLIMCKPPSDNKGNDRAPTQHEILCCQAQLKETIWSTKPQLIVALGTPATLALTGKGPITQVHGSFQKILPTFEWNCDVLCCFHPSYIMRQRQMIPVMLIDLQKVHAYFTAGEGGTGEVPNYEEKYKYLLDPTPQELSQYLSRCKKTVAFDTETTSLNPREAQILGGSLSELYSNEAVAFYLRPDDPRWPILKKWLRDKGTKKSTQNGQYDLEVCETAGITVQGWDFDTMLAEQLINSDGKKDLGHLRAIYTDIDPYKPTAREMKEISSWGKDRMLLYAAKDALCTQKVMSKQLPLLGEQQLDLMRNMLLPAARVLNKMERVGMRVDVPRLALMYAKVVPTMKRLSTGLMAKYQVNPDSPKQVCERFGLENAQKQTLEDWISGGHPQSEALQEILDYKELAKGSSTFLIGVYHRLEGDRVHSHYNASGTGTGRLSSSDPNLQNIQKRFRVIYIADTEKHILLAADYKQLELRVAAYLSQDDLMIHDLESGLDLHQLVSDRIDPFVPEKLKIEKSSVRTIAKTVVFGTLYGRTSAGIANIFKVPTYVAKQWQEMCFSRYPQLGEWIEDRKDDSRQRGYVTTPFGRKRFVQNQRQGVNAPIQSTANDINLGSIILLDKAGLDLRLTTHDENVVQCLKKEKKDAAHCLQEEMVRPIKEMGGAKFPVDIKQGSNWYEMEAI